MACPTVSGLAALILSRYPELTPQQVREALWNTADDLGLPGFDPSFGWGRVNASNALRMDTVGPLVVAKWRADDDGTYPSSGNGDGVINPGETADDYPEEPGRALLLSTSRMKNLGNVFLASARPAY